MYRIVCLIVGFIFGSIPMGYIIAASKGVDITREGSGNVGTTNVMRSLGKKYGALTLLLDIIKAVIPIVAMNLIMVKNDDMRYLVTVYTGLGAMLGHDFCPFLHFNGGKGIATAAGVLLFIDPITALITILCHLILSVITKYVSLSSCIGILAFALINITHAFSGRSFGWPGFRMSVPLIHRTEAIVLMALIVILTWYRHKDNIKRLINGTERKFELNKLK